MALKMPKYQYIIDKKIEEIDICITKARGARKTKYSQEVYQCREVLEVYDSEVIRMKNELKADWTQFSNYEEREVFNKLDKKFNDIHSRIVAEIKNDKHYSEMKKN